MPRCPVRDESALARSRRTLSRSQRKPGTRRSRRRACSRPAARSTSTACTARISAGIFPVVQRRPADPVVEHRSAHGAVHRRVQAAPVAAQDAGAVHRRSALRDAHRHALSHEVIRACSRQRAARPVRHLDRAADGRGLRGLPPRRFRAQRRDLDRRPAGRRPVLRGHRPGGVRRIDVHARARCIEDRTGRRWRRSAGTTASR